MRVILLSDSCTTGWGNWGHGELWLTPDSIVRIGKKSLTRAAAWRGAKAGVRGGAVGAVAREVARARTVMTVVDVAPNDWKTYLSGCSNVLTVPIADVARAQVKPGRSTSALKLRLRDGQHIKLLWMRNPSAAPLLEQALNRNT